MEYYDRYCVFDGGDLGSSTEQRSIRSEEFTALFGSAAVDTRWTSWLVVWWALHRRHSLLAELGAHFPILLPIHLIASNQINSYYIIHKTKSQIPKTNNSMTENLISYRSGYSKHYSFIFLNTSRKWSVTSTT